jgi:hypothetical protein
VGSVFCVTLISSYESRREGGQSAGAARDYVVFVGSAVIATLAVLYFFAERTTWLPDPYEPELNFTRETFFKTEKVTCRWHAYDSLDDEKLYGWCAKAKDGDWYLFVSPRD